MHAGELDPDWLDARKRQSEQFRAQGYKVRSTVEPGEAHRLEPPVFSINSTKPAVAARPRHPADEGCAIVESP